MSDVDRTPSEVSTRSALVEEATKKAGLLWLSEPETGRPRAAWHLWQDGAAYVVTGGAEQPLPGIVDAERVTVTVPSKDKGGRLVTWIALVTRVAPGTGEWERVVPELHGKRLNAPDGEDQPQRWAHESVLLRLEPAGEITEAPGTMPDGRHAAPPPPSPATTSGPLPYVLGRRRNRKGQSR